MEQTQYFKTLDRDAYVPQKISNDTFQMDYARKQNTSTLLTTIKWESAAGEYLDRLCQDDDYIVFFILDMVCDYRFHLYAKKQPPTGPPIQGIDRNLQVTNTLCEPKRAKSIFRTQNSIPLLINTRFRSLIIS